MARCPNTRCRGGGISQSPLGFSPCGNCGKERRGGSGTPPPRKAGPSQTPGVVGGGVGVPPSSDFSPMALGGRAVVGGWGLRDGVPDPHLPASVSFPCKPGHAARVVHFHIDREEQRDDPGRILVHRFIINRRQPQTGHSHKLAEGWRPLCKMGRELGGPVQPRRFLRPRANHPDGEG